MTTTRAGRWAMALVAWVAALAMTLTMTLTMTWSTAGPAQAGLPYDRVPTARHRILGQHLTNHHTHMETWIVGWYPYQRRVRIHHHWRRKTFYGLRVSAQHCNRHRCWGRVVAGKLWSPHQPGRPLRAGSITRGSALRARARRPVHPGHHVVRRPVELVRRLHRPAPAEPRAPLRGPVRSGILGRWRCGPHQEPVSAHPVRGWRDHRRSGSLGLRGATRRRDRRTGRMHDRRRCEGLPDRQGSARPPEPVRPRSPAAWLGGRRSAPTGAPRRS